MADLISALGPGPPIKLAAGGRSLDVTPIGLALKPAGGKKSIVCPGGASTNKRAFAPSPVFRGSGKASQRPHSVTPVNGNVSAPPA